MQDSIKPENSPPETKFKSKYEGSEMPELPSRDTLREAFLANEAKMRPQDLAMIGGVVKNLNHNAKEEQASTSFKRPHPDAEFQALAKRTAARMVESLHQAGAEENMNQQTIKHDEVGQLLAAARFAAERHSEQRRKGARAEPYINHPLAVADILRSIGEVEDVDVLIAAILHDTVEDTATTPAELEARFGVRVRALVEEVTDDKNLPKARRKELQIEHAPHLSVGARQIKLADKTSNVADVAFNHAPDWTLERRHEYLVWSEAVVKGLRGCNDKLEENFDRVLSMARAKLDENHKENN